MIFGVWDVDYSRGSLLVCHGDRQVGVYKIERGGGRKVKRCTAGRGVRNNDNDGVGELISCLGMVSSAAIFIIVTYYLSTIYSLQLFFLSLTYTTKQTTCYKDI